MNINGATYDSEEPVAACIGAERENSYELLVKIDEDLEVTYLVGKNTVPQEFRKYGLPVWLINDDGKMCFEKRDFLVPSETNDEPAK